MDQDRQGFVEFVEHVHPMRSVYTQIAKTGRGLYTKLNMERGKHFNDLCKNMQGVLNMIAQGKIKVNKDESELSGLRRYDRDLCRALKNRRKFRERVKSMKTGPQMSRSIAKLANKALGTQRRIERTGKMETIPRGPGPQTYTGQGQVLPQGQGQGQGQVVAPAGPSSYGQPGAHGGQFRGAGDSIMVGRGMLADLRQLMQKVANATQQTAVAIQSQNPIPNPYVRELQDKQAQYLELLNKPNKTALDQFYIKRLGLRIKELIERVQTEQAAPKSVTLKEPTLREGVGEALEDAAQNNTLNLVQQRRPERRQVDHHPNKKKEQQQDEWEEQEEEETPKGTGKQQRKKGRKLKYTQAPPTVSVLIQA